MFCKYGTFESNERTTEMKYLCTYSRLSLFRIPRDSLKHFEISVPRDIRVAEVRKTINWITTFNKGICNLTPEVRNMYKIMWKKGEIAPMEQFLLFSTMFCYLFLDFHVKTGTRIALLYKRLFEIREFEISRVDCTWFYWVSSCYGLGNVAHAQLPQVEKNSSSPVTILYKSIAGRYRPVSYPDGPITARYRFIKNADWVF